ncbi:hypothetical protein [Streptomyces mangrovisoli]|uniref:Uncharacterized protein n=1 Tax=Streptomyces mangrovisoli TaxID=1428628 RepID=A0A1J4NY91_9ACTN|nr:hypothetical protein [Streptomyces mangrovisoli]OIJ67447.1 hypothetical protein WN71_012715 [Streptomyces mangrovisoli]
MSQTTPTTGPPADGATGDGPSTSAPADAPALAPAVPRQPARRAMAQSVPPGAPRTVAPAAPPAPSRGNALLGLAAATGTGMTAAILYGVVIGISEREFAYAAVGVGLLVGVVTGRVGGRSQTLPVISVIVTVAAIYLGQLIGEAMLIAKEAHVGFGTVFFDHFGLVQSAWQDDVALLSFVFLAIGAYAAFRSTSKAAG